METMSTKDVREFIGYKRLADARTWCLRKEIQPLDYRDRSGSLLWPAEQVRQAWENRPRPHYQRTAADDDTDNP